MARFILYSLIILVFGSCSEYAVVVKKGTMEEKYDLALKLYKKNDFVRAIPLFDDLLAYYRGKEKSEEIYFYYCYSHYGLGQYELAAYHFKSFTETFYNSKHMEECSYMYTKCLYKDAMPYYLDQSSTSTAIEETQLFLNKFPNTQYKEACNQQIEDLRKRLKKKAFEIAMLWYRIEDYNAAVVSFKNTLKDFPDMENKDEIEFMIVKASYYYAKYSIYEKKEERYLAVEQEYKEFARNNKPENQYYAAATAFNAKARAELEKHRKITNIQ